MCQSLPATNPTNNVPNIMVKLETPLFSLKPMLLRRPANLWEVPLILAEIGERDTSR